MNHPAPASAAPAFADHLLPPPGARLLLAVSAGADSMALWELLARDRRWPLAVWHLDHGLRPDAALDGALIRARAAAHAAEGLEGAAVTIEACELRVLAAGWRIGLEEAGRRQRYARLAALGRELGAAAVLTAHHRDDQAETVLANLLRGSGPLGLAGMPARRELAPGLPLLRPLLGASRDDLRAWLLAHGRDWREDATNRDQGFRRNFLRHAVLPAFESGVPGFTAALLARAARAAAQVAVLEPRVEALWNAAWDGAGLRLALLAAAPVEVRRMLWRRLLARLGLPIARQHLHDLERLLSVHPGLRHELAGVVFVRTHATLAWEAARPQASAEVVRVDRPEADRTRRCDRAGERLALRLAPPPDDARTPPGAAWLDAERIGWPLVWRLPTPGERWRPLGCPGHQTVIKSLAERGVPSRRRPLTPLLADEQGVVWIPGHAVAERARIGPGARQAAYLERQRACPEPEAGTMSGPGASRA